MNLMNFIKIYWNLSINKSYCQKKKKKKKQKKKKKKKKILN